MPFNIVGIDINDHASPFVSCYTFSDDSNKWGYYVSWTLKGVSEGLHVNFWRFRGVPGSSMKFWAALVGFKEFQSGLVASERVVNLKLSFLYSHIESLWDPLKHLEKSYAPLTLKPSIVGSALETYLEPSGYSRKQNHLFPLALPKIPEILSSLQKTPWSPLDRCFRGLQGFLKGSREISWKTPVTFFKTTLKL